MSLAKKINKIKQEMHIKMIDVEHHFNHISL